MRNTCENIRFCEHCVANFKLAYDDEEHVDPFFCRVAELRREFVETEIKKIVTRIIMGTEFLKRRKLKTYGSGDGSTVSARYH